MARFAFRLESLLRYRLYRRDRIRALYAQILEQRNVVQNQQTELTQQRAALLEELRQVAGNGPVDVPALSQRRFHAGRLALEIQNRRVVLQTIEEQLQRCRKELQTAEQDVEVLQRLKEKQRRQFAYLQQRRNQQELEDVWSANQVGEYTE